MKRILFFLVVFICACSWRSPNSKFYMMNSQGLLPLSSRQFNIAVSKVKVSDLLNRSQMVIYRSDNNQIEILEFDRWGEVLPDVIQTTVVNDLIDYLPNSFIKRTYFDSQSATYNLNIEINTLRAYRGEKVVLSVWWNISNSVGKTLCFEQRTYETRVNGQSIESLVKAQSEAIHQMSKDIAERLLELPS